MIDYESFLKSFDKKLKIYFEKDAKHICCKSGCSACCETGDYPISQLELEYIMKGFAKLNNDIKRKVQENIKTVKKGGACPFLVEKLCSIYPYRPIICRVHGLAYLCTNNKVKVPYCVNNGKNYSAVYSDESIVIDPVSENLDTPDVLKNFEYGEIRNLYDWIKS